MRNEDTKYTYNDRSKNIKTPPNRNNPPAIDQRAYQRQFRLSGWIGLGLGSRLLKRTTRTKDHPDLCSCKQVKDWVSDAYMYHDASAAWLSCRELPWHCISPNPLTLVLGEPHGWHYVCLSVSCLWYFWTKWGVYLPANSMCSCLLFATCSYVCDADAITFAERYRLSVSFGTRNSVNTGDFQTNRSSYTTEIISKTLKS